MFSCRRNFTTLVALKPNKRYWYPFIFSSRLLCVPAHSIPFKRTLFVDSERFRHNCFTTIPYAPKCNTRNRFPTTRCITVVILFQTDIPATNRVSRGCLYSLSTSFFFFFILFFLLDSHCRASVWILFSFTFFPRHANSSLDQKKKKKPDKIKFPFSSLAKNHIRVSNVY